MSCDTPAEPIRPKPSCRDAFLVATWMRGFYRRHFGEASVEGAIESCLAEFEHAMGGSPPRSTLRNSIPPPLQLCQTLGACCKQSTQYSCCQRHICNSTATLDFFAQCAEVLRTERRKGFCGAAVQQHKSFFHIHRSAEVLSCPSSIDLIPSVYHERTQQRYIRDDEVMCAAEHGALQESPCSLTIRNYGQPQSSRPTHRHAGINHILTSGSMPRWSDVTLYGVEGVDDCEAAISALSQGLHAAATCQKYSPKRLLRGRDWRLVWVGAMRTLDTSVLFDGLCAAQSFLRELRLEACPTLMGKECASNVKRLLLDLWSLERVSLRGNPQLLYSISGAATMDLPRELGEALGASRGLTSLDLSLCALSDLHVEQLLVSAATAEGSSPSLTKLYHLDLSNNKLSSNLFVRIGREERPLNHSQLPCEPARVEESEQLLCGGATDQPPPHREFVGRIVSLDVTGNELMHSGAALVKCVQSHLTGLCRIGLAHSAWTTVQGNGPSNWGMRWLKAWAVNLNIALESTYKCRKVPSLSVSPRRGASRSTVSDIESDIEVLLGGCSFCLGPEVKLLFQTVHQFCVALQSTHATCGRGSISLCATSEIPLQTLEGLSLQCVVKLDLRTCELRAEGTIALCSALERSGPNKLEALLLCDNSIAARLPPSGGKGKKGGRKGAGGADSSDGLQSLSKALRSHVSPNLRALHLSFNEFPCSSLRPLMLLLDQCSGSIEELNFSGHREWMVSPSQSSALKDPHVVRPPLVQLVHHIGEMMERRKDVAELPGRNRTADVKLFFRLIARDCDALCIASQYSSHHLAIVVD